jgi:hypothetical protein
MYTGDVLYQHENVEYSGAGFMILSQNSVILFHNTEKQNYQCLGGHIDAQDLTAKDPLMACALREANEETRFAIKKLQILPIKHIDLQNSTTKKYYRCYVVTGLNIEEFIVEYFRCKSDTSFQEACYFETDYVKRFPINNFLNCREGRYEYLCKDEYNEEHSIFGRTRIYMRSILNDKDISPHIILAPEQYEIEC